MIRHLLGKIQLMLILIRACLYQTCFNTTLLHFLSPTLISITDTGEFPLYNLVGTVSLHLIPRALSVCAHSEHFFNNEMSPGVKPNH